MNTLKKYIFLAILPLICADTLKSISHSTDIDQKLMNAYKEAYKSMHTSHINYNLDAVLHDLVLYGKKSNHNREVAIMHIVAIQQILQIYQYKEIKKMPTMAWLFGSKPQKVTLEIKPGLKKVDQALKNLKVSSSEYNNAAYAAYGTLAVVAAAVICGVTLYFNTGKKPAASQESFAQREILPLENPTSQDTHSGENINIDKPGQPEEFLFVSDDENDDRSISDFNSDDDDSETAVSDDDESVFHHPPTDPIARSSDAAQIVAQENAHDKAADYALFAHKYAQKSADYGLITFKQIDTILNARIILQNKKNLEIAKANHDAALEAARHAQAAYDNHLNILESDLFQIAQETFTKAEAAYETARNIATIFNVATQPAIIQAAQETENAKSNSQRKMLQYQDAINDIALGF